MTKKNNNIIKTNSQIISEREEKLSEINKLLELFGIDSSSSEIELNESDLPEIYFNEKKDDKDSKFFDDDELDNLDEIF